MTLSEKITLEVESLPEAVQEEVLDFVEFLKARRLQRNEAGWAGFPLGRALQGCREAVRRVMSRSRGWAGSFLGGTLPGLEDECISLEVTLIKSSGLIGTAGFPAVLCRYAAHHLGDWLNDGTITVIGFQRETTSWRQVGRATTVAEARVIVEQLAALRIPGCIPDVVPVPGTAKTWETILVHVRHRDNAATFEIADDGDGFKGKDADALRNLFRSLFALAGFDYDRDWRSLVGPADLDALDAPLAHECGARFPSASFRAPDSAPETADLHDRPRKWFCGYCGYRQPDHAVDDIRCKQCQLMRPFLSSFMTVFVCECRQVCSAAARYCEWCGRRFRWASDADPSPENEEW